VRSRAQRDPTTLAPGSARGQQLPARALGCSCQLCGTSPPCQRTQDPRPRSARSRSPCPPAALRQRGSEWDWGCWGPGKGQSSWGPPGCPCCPRAPDPVSSPSAVTPFLHVPFVPSSCWDGPHVASCPAPPPAQSHHSDPPGSARGHHSCIFIFTFLQNPPPRLSASPSVSREAPRPRLTSWGAARGARPPAGDSSPRRAGRTLAAALAPGSPDVAGVLGWREDEEG